MLSVHDALSDSDTFGAIHLKMTQLIDGARAVLFFSNRGNFFQIKGCIGCQDPLHYFIQKKNVCTFTDQLCFYWLGMNYHIPSHEVLMSSVEILSVTHSPTLRIARVSTLKSTMSTKQPNHVFLHWSTICSYQGGCLLRSKLFEGDLPAVIIVQLLFIQKQTIWLEGTFNGQVNATLCCPLLTADAVAISNKGLQQ